MAFPRNIKISVKTIGCSAVAGGRLSAGLISLQRHDPEPDGLMSFAQLLEGAGAPDHASKLSAG